MSKIQSTVRQIHELDGGRGMKAGGSLHPLVCLLVTFLYIVIVVSFDKYDLWGLSGMIIYPLVLGMVYEISIKECFARIWPVLLVVIAVGIANPFFDRQVHTYVAGIAITGGMISMVTLMIKGILSVVASYVLIQMTGMQGICYSLRCLHIPKEIVTILLLIYRYLILLLKEVERMSQAYHMRAPKQKGIQMKHWGAFAGRLLLRSVDRAEIVYESMLLRGYNGEFPVDTENVKMGLSLLYILIWVVVLVLCRCVPLFLLVGSLF